MFQKINCWNKKWSNINLFIFYDKKVQLSIVIKKNIYFWILDTCFFRMVFKVFGSGAITSFHCCVSRNSLRFFDMKFRVSLIRDSALTFLAVIRKSIAFSTVSIFSNSVSQNWTRSVRLYLSPMRSKSSEHCVPMK